MLTDNIKIYSDYYKNPITASRYMYVDFKCKNDKWTKRDKPKWFIDIEKNLKPIKKKIN